MKASTAVLAGIGATTAVVVGALAQAGGDNSPIGTAALSATVPAEYRGLVEEAGNSCPELSPNLLAALLQQESGFNPKAQSPAGAQGIAQFIPSTWVDHGVDGNGDGKEDVWDPEDAIPASGEYLCTLADEVADVPGDKRSNMLAAYNAGGPAVKKYGGVPPYKETQNYVQTISTAADKTPGGKTTTTNQAVTVINAAEEKIGKPYSWGGGNANGESSGVCCSPSGKTGVGIVGFDCSGLTLYAYAKAGITLPRTAAQQYAAAEPVKPGQMRPGDLVFYGNTAASIHHVGIYVGNGYIINAPRPGAKVRYDPMDMMSDLYGVARPTQNTNKEI
ncbi:bifunctional lytic transglycosylase/C40 family peptidase (plasmid) [Streptomyces globisporus]|uniref:C40 family peptidase n=1 Tax=Streptomyces globisporus TaxID=1908 RepID=UPI002F912B8D|nr:bifunctional lytic transglycosylase/C40 family peptidase [Streptomyces globisporus]